MFQDQALLYSFKIYIFIFLFFAQFGYIFHMEKHSIIFMKPYKNLLVKPCGIEGQKIWATSPKNNMLGTLILPFIQQHDLFLNMKQTRKHFQSDNEFAETSSQRESKKAEFPLPPSPLLRTAVALLSPQCTVQLSGHCHTRGFKTSPETDPKVP